MDRISALMDGELTAEEAARLVAGVREHEGLREAWATYHLIGEALRGEPCPDCSVASSVARRLAQEPTVLAPRRRLPAADIGRRWALPSLAAAAAVATVTWMAVEMQQGEPAQPFVTPAHLVVPTVAVRSNPSVPEYTQSVHLPANTPASVPIQFSARGFDAYLMAHQEFSPSSTLQGLAPYVRTVTSGAVETGR